MRKLTALVFAVALVLGVTTLSNAQVTYNYQTIHSTSVNLHWPNEANSANIFEADTGLLGRVMPDVATQTGGLWNLNTPNACELAPSFPCEAGSPPTFLLPTGAAEGPAGSGGGSECNRRVNACNGATVPPAAHGGHVNSTEGTLSYLVIHTPPGATEPAGKGIGFFDGSYSIVQQAYGCNECPVGGVGKDVANQVAIDNTTAGAIVQSTNVSLWLTQSTSPFGHALVSLVTAGPGKTSVCGNAIVFQDLDTNLCAGSTTPGVFNGVFTIPGQKVVAHTYSVDMANHASFGAKQLCNPPDCYIQNVVIPLAQAQLPGACGSGGACNVQVQSATSVLPSDAPGSLANATVDSLLYFVTDQKLDFDNDGVEDRTDPCPNDGTDFCTQDLITGGGATCPTGTVFCMNAAGTPGCHAAYLCDTRRDVNQDCVPNTSDVTTITGSPLFNQGLPIGPFDP